jgi:hypothetical protein
MGWIDDLARWAADEDRETAWSRPVSRRGVLALFGGTAAATATGTLGVAYADDPPTCCADAGGSALLCDDLSDCCCSQDEQGNNVAECCTPSVGQTCVDNPSPGPLNGPHAKTCCAFVCGTQCCRADTDVCTAQGRCLACADGEKCGQLCCESGTHCVGGDTCVCDTGGVVCNGECCAPGEDCVDLECVPGCPEGSVPCGPDRTCCAPGPGCEGGVCVQCVSPRTACGGTCCEAGETCCASKGLCCPGDTICRQGFASCVCPDGTCACGEHCCTSGTYCDREAGVCSPCPSGQKSCGDTCCPNAMQCTHVNLTGAGGCGGICACPSGGQFCGDQCCTTNQTCVAGVCHDCPRGSDACGDHCCEPPFVCTFGTCDCPDGRGEPCGGACCETNEECVSDTCRPKCELGTVRCGDVCCAEQPPEPDQPAKVKPPKTVTVEHGSAPITVSCTGGCSGSVTLETVAAHPSILAVIAGRKRRVVLGKASFKVAKGRKSTKVRVHLSHSGTRYLAKHHGKLKVQVLVRTKGAKAAFLSRVFTLKGPKPKK